MKKNKLLILFIIIIISIISCSNDKDLSFRKVKKYTQEKGYLYYTKMDKPYDKIKIFYKGDALKYEDCRKDHFKINIGKNICLVDLISEPDSFRKNLKITYKNSEHIYNDTPFNRIIELGVIKLDNEYLFGSGLDATGRSGKMKTIFAINLNDFELFFNDDWFPNNIKDKTYFDYVSKNYYKKKNKNIVNIIENIKLLHTLE